jgi:hypothetical protein
MRWGSGPLPTASGVRYDGEFSLNGNAPVAQLAEHLTLNQRVQGSSPCGGIPALGMVSHESAETGKSGLFLCAVGGACDSVRAETCRYCAGLCAAFDEP